MTSLKMQAEVDELKRQVAAILVELERRRPGRPPKDKAE